MFEVDNITDNNPAAVYFRPGNIHIIPDGIESGFEVEYPGKPYITHSEIRELAFEGATADVMRAVIMIKRVMPGSTFLPKRFLCTGFDMPMSVAPIKQELVYVPVAKNNYSIDTFDDPDQEELPF